MIGIIYYIYFLILGFLYSKYIFNKNIYFHIWIGGVIGNIILMVGIIIPSFIFGFTILSHIILLLLATIPLIFLIRKKGFKWKSINTKNDEMNWKIFTFVIIPIFILIAILLTNHILVPTETGGVATGQSTYGDLNMHLGLITGIKEQQVFPPNYVFLAGTKINYPFFVENLSSSIYSFGASLRLSVLLPSYVLCFLLVLGFYYLAYKISESRKASVLATIFFFLGGGFGFAYFFDGAKGDISLFTRIFNDYYHTPTNYDEMNIKWVNPICDMIVPQRTTMAGWFMMMPCLWFLIDACKTNKRKSFIILGILASVFPMINTHAFLSLGVISIGMFILYFVKSHEKKEIFNNWFIYGMIVLVIGFPQLFYWTFTQAVNGGFVKFHFNWVNHSDPYIWFYIKNWGLVAIFTIPAYFIANKDNRKLMLSALLLFIIAELFVFQPLEYDNNKLFFIAYMIFLINCCSWYMNIFDRLKKEKIRYYFLVIVIILSTLSGVLTIGREMYSGGMYETFNYNMINLAEYIKEKTDKDAIFLTGTAHINPVTSLAGRNAYVGASLYLYFHGFPEELAKREEEIRRAYEGSYEELVEFCNSHNISYIYIGEHESYEYQIKDETLSKLKIVSSFGRESLYKIS